MKLDDSTIAIIVLCVLATLGAGHLADLIFIRIKALIREAIALYSENKMYNAWKKSLMRKIDESTKIVKE